MSYDDFIVLGAVPGSEQAASCGCRFVMVKQRALDKQSGHYVTGDAMVVIPCIQVEHVQLAKIAGEGHAAAPEQVLDRFEKLIEREESS